MTGNLHALGPESHFGVTAKCVLSARIAPSHRRSARQTFSARDIERLRGTATIPVAADSALTSKRRAGRNQISPAARRSSPLDLLDLPHSFPSTMDSADSLRAPSNDGGVVRRTSGRGPLSCAECRRLKLKCDRVWPCTPCQRRGCSAICPDGMQELVLRTNEMGTDDGGLQAH